MNTGVPARAPVATARASGERTTTMRAEERRVARAAYLFLLPTFVLFFVFVAGPLVAAIYLSFTYYDVFSPPKWVGLENYGYLLQDQRTLASLRNTGIFVIFSTAIEIVLALLLAVGVQRQIAPLPTFMRTRRFLGGVAALAVAPDDEPREDRRSRHRPYRPRLRVDEFGLEGGAEAFRHGVVVTIAGTAHRGDDAVRCQGRLVGGGGVLAAAVGVLCESGCRPWLMPSSASYATRFLLLMVGEAVDIGPGVARGPDRDQALASGCPDATADRL